MSWYCPIYPVLYALYFFVHQVNHLLYIFLKLNVVDHCIGWFEVACNMLHSHRAACML
jgi:hypothetical protein